jgi:hypothetical protein
LEEVKRVFSMVASASLHKRKTLFWVVLLVAFFAFAADVVDLREDLRILPCASASLDNNVSTGLIYSFIFNPEPVLVLRSVDWKSSVEISFLHLTPCGLRAPPSRS